VFLFINSNFCRYVDNSFQTFQMFLSFTLYKTLSTHCKCYFYYHYIQCFKCINILIAFDNCVCSLQRFASLITQKHNYKLLFLKFQLFYLLFVACTSIYFIIILFNHHLHVTLRQKKPPQSHNIQRSKTFIHHFNTTQIALFILLNSLLHCMRRFSNVLCVVASRHKELSTTQFNKNKKMF
jgi:hypothetical protein